MDSNKLFRECIVVVVLLSCTALVGANPFMGEYKGTYHPDGKTTMEAFAQVIAEGDDVHYRIVIGAQPNEENQDGAHRDQRQVLAVPCGQNQPEKRHHELGREHPDQAGEQDGSGLKVRAEGQKDQGLSHGVDRHCQARAQGSTEEDGNRYRLER